MISVGQKIGHKPVMKGYLNFFKDFLPIKICFKYHLTLLKITTLIFIFLMHMHMSPLPLTHNSQDLLYGTTSLQAAALAVQLWPLASHTLWAISFTHSKLVENKPLYKLLAHLQLYSIGILEQGNQVSLLSDRMNFTLPNSDYMQQRGWYRS